MENIEEKEMGSFWTEEFEPKTIDDMVLTQDLKKQFKDMVSSRTRFNLLLSGKPGIGKTTLAKVIANELNASVMFIKCGLEGNVETAKTRLLNFCQAIPIDGRPKLVILDELDSASGTQDNSFQKVLRNIISEYQDTMFIGTCNYPEKVILPIRQSRLGAVQLKFTGRDLYDHIKNILETKKISYTVENLKKFVVEVVKTYYPDIRRIISILSNLCSSGELVIPETSFSVVNDGFVEELVKYALNNDSFETRKFYVQNKSKIEDYMEFSSRIFNYVLDSNIIHEKDKILAMADTIYQMNVVVDKEIQFYKLITIIGK